MNGEQRAALGICCSIKKVRTDKFCNNDWGPPISHRRVSLLNGAGKTRAKVPYWSHNSESGFIYDQDTRYIFELDLRSLHVEIRNFQPWKIISIHLQQISLMITKYNNNNDLPKFKFGCYSEIRSCRARNLYVITQLLILSGTKLFFR